MILLGVDFGFKRIGLALTDSKIGLPTALQTMEATGTLKRDAENIAQRARREGADTIVLGLPVEPSGEEGRMARICRQLAEHLQGHGLSVHLVDEAMSSFLSEGSMIEAGMKASHRKKRLDGKAASVILERYLNQNHGGNDSSTS